MIDAAYPIPLLMPARINHAVALDDREVDVERLPILPFVSTMAHMNKPNIDGSETMLLNQKNLRS